MTIPDLWNRVIENWHRLNAPIRSGVTLDAISAFQTKYRVVLPTDVRDYFLTADGTGDDVDDYLFRFWPLAEVKPVHEELADFTHGCFPDRFAYPDCFVFADHCGWCWAYAFKLSEDPIQLAPVFRVTGSNPPGEQMASSFRDFMEQYADDPDNIL